MTANMKRTDNLKPTVFSYGEKMKLESYNFSGQPWFVAIDVCKALALDRHTHKHVGKLDDDEKLCGKFFRTGQFRDIWLVNESGLYNLIFRSNKPEAKQFRKWVTGEVLPTIRRTGSYTAKPARIETPLSTALALSGSQNKLAIRLGISNATMSAYINGSVAVAKDTALRISKAISTIAERGNSVDYSTLEMLLSIDDQKSRQGLYQKLKSGGLI